MNADIDCVDYFAAMARLSAQMLEAAEAGDWDRLASDEQQLGQLRQFLVARKVSLEDADPQAQQAVRGFIEQILADDEKIRARVLPWMESTRKYLGKLQRGKTMQNAYGGMSGY